MPLTNLIITAYCACHICCGPKPTGLTASGLRPVEGRTIAVGRRDIPFGTKLVLFGTTFVVDDRMAKRYDVKDRTHIDIYFRRHSDAKRFGVRKL